MKIKRKMNKKTGIEVELHPNGKYVLRLSKHINPRIRTCFQKMLIETIRKENERKMKAGAVEQKRKKKIERKEGGERSIEKEIKEREGRIKKVEESLDKLKKQREEEKRISVLEKVTGWMKQHKIEVALSTSVGVAGGLISYRALNYIAPNVYNIIPACSIGTTSAIASLLGIEKLRNIDIKQKGKELIRRWYLLKKGKLVKKWLIRGALIGGVGLVIYSFVSANPEEILKLKYRLSLAKYGGKRLSVFWSFLKSQPAYTFLSKTYNYGIELAKQIWTGGTLASWIGGITWFLARNKARRTEAAEKLYYRAAYSWSPDKTIVKNGREIRLDIEKKDILQLISAYGTELLESAIVIYALSYGVSHLRSAIPALATMVGIRATIWGVERFRGKH